MIRVLYMSIISFFIIGCTNIPYISQQNKTVHKHIKSNQQEAKLAQEEYKQIKNKRINS